MQPDKRANPLRRWFVFRGEKLPAAVTWLNLLLVAVAISAFFGFALSRLRYDWSWSGVWEHRQLFWHGWLTTLGVSAAALVGSTLMGTACALARLSSIVAFRIAARAYVEMVRGTPLLVQIYIFFYIVADAFSLSNRYVMGVVILSIFAGAYIGEIIRAGIEGIGKTQLESARAVGFTTFQTYRFVIFPQAILRILPALVGQFVSIIKDSSLLSVIGVSELTLNARAVNNFTFNAFESFLPLAVGYLLLTLPISIWTRQLEDRLRYDS